MLEIIAIPAFRDNYIWALRAGHEAVVVDPGDAAPVLAWLAQENVALKGILITHHHQDHQGGVAGLLDRDPGLPVFGPAAESITGLNRPLAGGETLQVLGLPVQVWAVPGHTRGHLAYLLEDYQFEDALFCGDTLFGAGCGRLFEGTPEQMFQAMEKIAALPDNTRIFCAHEYTLQNLAFAALVEPENPAILARIEACERLRQLGQATVPSTLAEEKATNPFLRHGVQAVAARARERNPEALLPVQVFATLRAWRDEF
ncbi:MAG: hydroxyacylglutathione hydrolase [Azovibrio sp.]|uniref:hydroxyacylglutathione hydrolase n=1 Tax=Azovibrio sp. TaxID=1872673 RepID=UPI003C74EB6E